MLSVQVNLRTILKNVVSIKKRLNPGTKFCAVVKADAYGLGIERISKLLAAHVDCFAVATINEAIKLRTIGIKQDILLFGVCHAIPTAIKYNIIITVENASQARQIIKAKLHPRIHLAVNTNMNRFGLMSVHEVRETLQLLKQEKVEGVYTHLAFESDQIKHVRTALTRFKKFTYICRQYFPQIMTHAGCSGVLDYPPAHFDMIRIGKALYGGFANTRTAIKVTSQIVAVKKIKTGETVGYCGTFTANRPTVIGIVHGGYANGIPPQFSNTVNVLVGKQLCPVIGRVCMDYFFIDVSKIKDPMSQPVTIISNHNGQNLIDIAQKAKMITCNLLVNLCHYNNHKQIN